MLNTGKHAKQVPTVEEELDEKNRSTMFETRTMNDAQDQADDVFDE